MIPDYTAEFVWIMSKYRAGRHEDLVGLLASPSMRRHIAPHLQRINELLEEMQKNELNVIS